MPHTTAIKVFNGIHNAGSAPPLAQLYAALVALELSLKDYHHAQQGTWIPGHSICAMLSALGESSVSLQLQNNLVKIDCTGRNGTGVKVGATTYPDIRYLRHVMDHPAWPQSSDDQLLLETLHDAQLCLQILRNKGVAP